MCKCMVAAHRGVTGGNIPCNTIESFKAALNHGADIIELDVIKSLDGELFVFHDGNQYPHVNIEESLTTKTAEQIRKIRYVNCDRVITPYCVSSLDEVLEVLKGKVLINIDRSWDFFSDTVKAIRRHKMEDGIILKSPDRKRCIDEIAEIARDMKYMPIINGTDTLEYLFRKIKPFGLECIFETEDSPLVGDGFIGEMKKIGVKLWANSLVFNSKVLLAAGHDDDVSVTKNPDDGWGWLMDKGFDIIQTDFTPSLKQYIRAGAL